MSSVKLEGNPSGSGSVSLKSPSTNSDIIVTLPDTTMTLSGPPSTTHGDVGTYLYGYYNSNGATVASGASIAGSSIRAAGMGWNTGSDGYERAVLGDGVSKSGTWRFMGSMSTNINGRYPGGIWVRLS